ncbi:hypothetical protein QBC38DRAFT_111182 [Podospora fimiseda]|uniref:Uncharacterized protein n=1 Tax=Podospora fimiseda TaxID=252190 RepID=A0AAN6YP21_9PEZI|nr:hypothetical protein QBC38DRAFT_111182 [Podospora fimiseda]
MCLNASTHLFKPLSSSTYLAVPVSTSIFKSFSIRSALICLVLLPFRIFKMANTFYLVPGVQGSVGHAVDNPGLTCNFNDQAVSNVYYRLAQHWQAGSGCQMVVEFSNGQGYQIMPVRNSSSRSGGTGEHAEEVLLTALNDIQQVQITGAIINLPPCDGGRYQGKQCMDYFRPNGRVFNGVARRFIPLSAVTPIFYREGQTAKGNSAETTVGVKNQPGAIEEMLHKPGLIPGQSYYAAKDKKWFIAGQESSGATEADLLKRLMAIKPSSRKGELPVTQATWYWKNVKPSVAKNVFARLPKA